MLPYIDFLVPIFVMSVFGAMGTAIGLASDVKSGLLERLRAMPSAVLAGCTLADVVRNVFVILLGQWCRVSDGFRVHTDLLGYLGGIALVLLFGYRSPGCSPAGLAVKDPETAQAAAFPIMAPLVFGHGVRARQSMASWLQPFAEHQPVSVTASAARSLMMGTPNNGHILQSLLWIIGIIAVAALGRSAVPTGHLIRQDQRLARSTR